MIYLMLDTCNFDTFVFSSLTSFQSCSSGLVFIRGTTLANTSKDTNSTRGIMNRLWTNVNALKDTIKIIGMCFINKTLPKGV